MKLKDKLLLVVFFVAAVITGYVLQMSYLLSENVALINENILYATSFIAVLAILIVGFEVRKKLK